MTQRLADGYKKMTVKTSCLDYLKAASFLAKMCRIPKINSDI